jgi:hypothetical protein
MDEEDESVEESNSNNEEIDNDNESDEHELDIEEENENEEKINEGAENEKKNDSALLNSRLAEIIQSRPATETLAFSSTQILNVPNVGDDLQREVELYVIIVIIWIVFLDFIFSYRQTVGVLETAFATLEKNGVEYQRPSDFFTTMAKSDAQMEKVDNLFIV